MEARLAAGLPPSALSTLLVAGFAASFGAQAQTASTPKPIIEELRQQERERALREQQERTTDERLKPVAIDAQTLPEGETPCFRPRPASRRSRRACRPARRRHTRG